MNRFADKNKICVFIRTAIASNEVGSGSNSEAEIVTGWTITDAKVATAINPDKNLLNRIFILTESSLSSIIYSTFVQAYTCMNQS